MASIAGSYTVTLAGALTRRDLGRLERACGPPLAHRRVPLTPRMHRLTRVDPQANAFVRRLVNRGAIVLPDDR